MPVGAEASITYLNTLLIQDVLADGLVELTDEDWRGIRPCSGRISPRAGRSMWT